MKTFKKRHQLFLAEDISRRLEQRSKNSGKPKSDILVEALEAFFNKRDGGENLEAISVRLTSLDRKNEVLLRKQSLFWEAFARLLRHHLMMSAALPAPDQAQKAAAARHFQNFIDEMAERLAGKDAEPSDDPAIDKLRKFH
ncbi:hypothetical protein U1839_19025 [Sphingomonas sp. RT2P30]|uniref:hypothetical protein n=1 Tax=Parasphingomonas halimpatiens TaxID=3096162 RepID=UPI002FCBC21A